MIIGIDGGGTHTRLEIRDGENRTVRREMFGPFNLNAIGESAFRALLNQVFAACGNMAEAEKLCIGAAGSSNPEVGRILREMLDSSGFRGKYRLCGDQEIALRGAMDCPGIVLIAGTGSICFGRNAAGETARSGGFGHLIDDGGSGYALGRASLAETVRAMDGRGGDPEIRDAVLRFLGAKNAADIVAFTYAPTTDKAAIAKLPEVLLALSGNSRAAEILREQAMELRALVTAVENRLNLPSCPVALLGGLLEGDNPYRNIVADTLGTRAIRPAHDALWGAAQLAWEL